MMEARLCQLALYAFTSFNVDPKNTWMENPCGFTGY